jgi:hypothetical protein
MGASKHNPTTITTVGAGRFSSRFISECEADRCASFAIALSRLTHWPVEVIELVDELHVPYRFLCSDGAGEWSFDVTGVFRGERITDLVRRVLQNHPVALRGGTLLPGFKLYTEQQLRDGTVILPQPWSEAYIERCTEIIAANREYLKAMPTRPRPVMPTDAIGLYSFSNCSIYAEALSRLTGLPAVTMIPIEMIPDAALPEGGFHEFVLHSDGQGEDIWGKQPVERIARRYGLRTWRLDRDQHLSIMSESATRNPLAHAKMVADAEALLQVHHPAGRKWEKMDTVLFNVKS